MRAGVNSPALSISLSPTPTATPIRRAAASSRPVRPTGHPHAGAVCGACCASWRLVGAEIVAPPWTVRPPLA
jgi:hypothetical protein